jgi:hypothetical protein
MLVSGNLIRFEAFNPFAPTNFLGVVVRWCLGVYQVRFKHKFLCTSCSSM